MNSDWIKQGVGAAIPALTVLLAGLLANLSLPLIATDFGDSGGKLFTAMTPDFTFMAIYFWRMVRPDLLSPAFVFFAGFLVDALSGAPLGMSSLSYLIAILFVGRLARLIVPLSGLYWLGGFVFGALIVTGLSWVIASLWSLALIPFVPLLGALFWTILLYPPVAAMLAMLARLFVPVQASR